MSIHEKTGQTETITEGWRALELFTNRREEIRLFTTYLNEDPPRETLLFFHGDGGNGKSLLLRYLRQGFCKRIDPGLWQKFKAFNKDDFVAEFAKAECVQPVPSALIDFGMPPRGEDRPQEAFSALLTLHRDLSAIGLHFPLFDYACVWYLHKTGQLTKERLASLLPNEEIDFLSSLADAASGTALGALVKATFSIGGKWFGHILGIKKKIHGLQQKAQLYLKQRKMDQAQVEGIERMDPDRELIDHLPLFFAQDRVQDLLCNWQ